MKDVQCSVIIQWRDKDGNKRATLGSVPTPNNRDNMTDNEVAGKIGHHIARKLATEVDVDVTAKDHWGNEQGWGIIPENVDPIDNLYEFYRSGGLFHPDGHWSYIEK
jgi:hypothetical protein